MVLAATVTDLTAIVVAAITAMTVSRVGNDVVSDVHNQLGLYGI